MASLERPRVEYRTPEDLVRDVRRGLVRVPPFQRAFKWEAGDIVKLFDSLLQGFPIGNLLLWKRPAPAQHLQGVDLSGRPHSRAVAGVRLPFVDHLQPVPPYTLSAQSERRDGALGDRRGRLSADWRNGSVPTRRAPSSWLSRRCTGCVRPGSRNCPVRLRIGSRRSPITSGAASTRVHSRVGGVKGFGYAAAGVGSHGRPVRARVMASRAVRPWLRVVVR